MAVVSISHTYRDGGVMATPDHLSKIYQQRLRGMTNENDDDDDDDDGGC